MLGWYCYVFCELWYVGVCVVGVVDDIGWCWLCDVWCDVVYV